MSEFLQGDRVWTISLRTVTYGRISYRTKIYEQFMQDEDFLMKSYKRDLMDEFLLNEFQTDEFVTDTNDTF